MNFDEKNSSKGLKLSKFFIFFRWVQFVPCSKTSLCKCFVPFLQHIPLSSCFCLLLFLLLFYLHSLCRIILACFECFSSICRICFAFCVCVSYRLCNLRVLIKCRPTSWDLRTLPPWPPEEFWATLKLVSWAIPRQLSLFVHYLTFIKSSYPTFKGSVPSLAAGLTFGAILGYGALLTSQDPPRPLLQVGTSMVLAGMMGARWARSGKFMPPGIVCVLSCAILARGLLYHNRYLPLIGKTE